MCVCAHIYMNLCMKLCMRGQRTIFGSPWDILLPTDTSVVQTSRNEFPEFSLVCTGPLGPQAHDALLSNVWFWIFELRSQARAASRLPEPPSPWLGVFLCGFFAALLSLAFCPLYIVYCIPTLLKMVQSLCNCRFSSVTCQLLQYSKFYVVPLFLSCKMFLTKDCL